MRPHRFAWAVLLAAVGCSRPAAGGAVRGEPTPAVAADAPTPSSPEQIPVVHERPWMVALRMERWEEALALLAAEPASVRGRPEVRYAEAAAAERVGRFDRVVELLIGLEAELPSLSARIEKRRARAQLETRNAAAALEYYQRQSDVESRLNVAEALAILGDRAAARQALQTLIGQLPKRSTCALEARARLLLSQVLPDEYPVLVARELRWLAVTAPLCESSAGADERLSALGPEYALSKRDRADRARAFAEAGLVERTEQELAAMESARGVAPDVATVTSIRALARFEARSELDVAADLFLKAARANPTRAPEWEYGAARAHVRAGATDPALTLFQQIRKKYPKSSLAEYAEYQRAQLLYSSGRFAEAERAYDAYLGRLGRRGRFYEDALDERSVTWVVTGKAEKAASVFAELAATGDRRYRARYTHLEAVARLRAGQRERAEAGLRQVIAEQPLSFAALAAAARLESIGLPRPAITAPSAPAAQSAGELLVTLPPEADLLHRIGLDREAEQALAESERTWMQTLSGERDRALCMLYRRLATAERCYRIGYNAVTREELALAPRADRRWLWECVYPRPYGDLVRQSAAEHGLDSELIYAVMRQESSFRPEVVSPARAIGLLQILPRTGERLAREASLAFEPQQLSQPPTNVQLGARYLRKLIDVFSGNVALAVASYNAGPSAVLRWVEGAPNLELDLFVARIPYSETRGYVERVLSNYARYLYLTGGEGAVPRLSLELPTPRTEGVELY